jgi:hypothetical protein
MGQPFAPANMDQHNALGVSSFDQEAMYMVAALDGVEARWQGVSHALDVSEQACAALRHQ